MDRERRNALAELLSELFSDDQWAYYIRFMVMLVILAASFIALYFFDWRFWLLIPLAFIYSFIQAARYLDDLYEVSDLNLSTTYLMASSFFRNARPRAQVTDGKLRGSEDEVNLVERIGGPGMVYIAPNHAALLERLEGLSNVIDDEMIRASGDTHYDLRRYEYIKEVVTTEVQQTELRNVEGVTVDGIPVRVTVIRFRFKLKRSLRQSQRQQGEEVLDQSRYTEAVKNQSRNRPVDRLEIMSLEDVAQMIIINAVKKYINRHTIDQILTPDDRNSDSRQALKEVLENTEVRDAMRAIGVEMEKPVELGTFDFPDEAIDKYRLGKWKELKRGEIKVLEAEGKAYELSRQDAVRSRTQAEMIQGIITALDDLKIKDANDLDTLVKLRTAQILDTWSGLYKAKDEDEFNLDRYFRKPDGEEDAT